jgi:hypothetical protein
MSTSQQQRKTEGEPIRAGGAAAALCLPEARLAVPEDAVGGMVDPDVGILLTR